MMQSTYKPMKKVTDEAGVSLAEKEFHCRGSFGPMHKDRPNAKDLQDAAAFAKKSQNYNPVSRNRVAK